MTGVRILIVEDNPLESGPLKKRLKKNGYDEVSIADSMQDSIQQVKAANPSIILMDIGIPTTPGEKVDESGGIMAAREIKRISDAQIIFMTGQNVTEELMAEVANLDPFGFVRKPLEKQHVLDLIRLATLKRQRNKVIFLSYSRSDDKMRDELMRFLKPLEAIGVDPWVDTKIRTGDRWRIEIETALKRADAAVLLLSVDFLSSRFINEFELPRLLDAAQQRGLEIFPVFVGFVPTAHLDIGEMKQLREFQALNDSKDSIDGWDRSKRDREIWGPLCDDLARL